RQRAGRSEGMFVRMKALLAPATAVMNRLKYPQKFALISLLFVVPLALLIYFVISEVNAGIPEAQKEMAGNAYLQPLRRLLEHVPQAEEMGHLYSRGEIGVRPDLIRMHSEIDADFRALQATDKRLGSGLDTTEKLRTLTENWRFLKQKSLDLKTSDGDELYAKLIAEI